MGASLRHPDVRPAVPWIATAVAGSAMVSTAMPVASAWWRLVPLSVVVTPGLVVGAALCIVAIARGTARAPATWLLVGGMVAMPIAALLSMFAILLGPLVLVAPVAVATSGIVAFCLPRRADGEPASGVVAAASAVGLASVAIGVADGLVWLPQALVPGLPLDDVYAELARQGEDAGVLFVVAWGVCGAVATIAAALAALRHRLRPAAAAAATLLPALAALLLLPWWELSMGMGLSDLSLPDALPPPTGGMSDAMAWIGALAAVLGGAVAFGLTRPRRAVPATGASADPGSASRH